MSQKPSLRWIWFYLRPYRGEVAVLGVLSAAEVNAACAHAVADEGGYRQRHGYRRRAADRIIVFDKGRGVAQGTHDELMNGSPLYAQVADQLKDAPRTQRSAARVAIG